MKSKILILLILSITLSFAQGRGNNRMLTWEESLNLTTEQMQQITELRDAMQPAMMEIRQNTRTLEIELRQLSRSDSPDANRIAELETLIADNQTAIDQIQLSHHAYIRSLLTEDQQLIYDELNLGSHQGQGGRNTTGRGQNSNSGRGQRSGNGRW